MLKFYKKINWISATKRECFQKYESIYSAGDNIFWHFMGYGKFPGLVSKYKGNNLAEEHCWRKPKKYKYKCMDYDCRYPVYAQPHPEQCFL